MRFAHSLILVPAKQRTALHRQARSGQLDVGTPGLKEGAVWAICDTATADPGPFCLLRMGKPGLRLLLRLSLRWLGKAVLLFHLWFIMTTSLLVALYRHVDPPVTVLALSRKYLDHWTIRKPVALDYATIPLSTRRMLVSIEDSRFWVHHGIDLEAIKRAIAVNKDVGRPLHGGSTLSMQLARTLFLTPVKSYARKYLEAIITLELEAFLPKERIMELYFMWAEWGKGVFGIEAASRLYYKASASKLGLDPSARLLAILSSPIRFTPFTLEKHGQLRWRYDYLIKKYATQG